MPDLEDVRQEHEAKRQDIMEQLHRLVFDFEEEKDRPKALVAYDLSIVLFDHLLPKDYKPVFPRGVYLPAIAPAESFFERKLLPLITQFTQVEEERLFIISNLLRWTTEEFTSGFHSAILRLEVHHPEKLYGEEFRR